MGTKEILQDVAEKLPPDTTLMDAIGELEFRHAVVQGLAELDRGESIPIGEVNARIAEWAGLVHFWHGARGLPRIPRGTAP